MINIFIRFFKKKVFYFAFFLREIYISLYNVFYKKKKIVKKQPETLIDATNNYIKKSNQRFLELYNDGNEKKREEMNSNMNDIFYCKKKYDELLMNEKNPLEKKWEARILFEYTPRGNIMMYYNIYKQGFSYYSDINGINYNLLNAVAMKYVCLYKCLDFFLDDEITPENNASPLIDIHFKEKKNDEEKIENEIKTEEEIKKEKEKELFKKKLSNGPFAKFKKTYNEPSPLMKNRLSTKEQQENVKKTNKKIDKNEKEFNRNRFINMGKMINFNFIQSNVYKNNKNNVIKMDGFTSKLLDNLSAETNLQKQVLNYKEYKNFVKFQTS
jgi:hypothetical protein